MRRDCHVPFGVTQGYVMSSIVSQPSEVETLLNAAAQGGSKVVKAAKKGFFGGFAAVYQAPDGAIWKLAAPTKKGYRPSVRTAEADRDRLGVATPKASKTFYVALGVTIDRDYSNKFVDFALTPGNSLWG